MLGVRDNSWSPNCISQGCMTHNLHCVTLSHESGGSAGQSQHNSSQLWCLREWGPGGAGEGAEEDNWSQGDGAAASQRETEKAETPLQFGEKAAEQGHDWGVPVHKGGGLKDIPQYCYKDSNTRAASWGDPQAEALLPRVWKPCLGMWQHQGGNQASQAILWFYDTIRD